MRCQRLYFSELLVFEFILPVLSSLLLRETLALADIHTDTILGSESSVLKPGVEMQAATGDIILGLLRF
ncbi:hypothetical protein [Calothrix sp. NIES-2098]|uniref:hypothetical protein n=1 Tax=Calothrix sp. NIES-2098 TaxID=1954171 RepID=UPI000B617975|nr:hypothetical protein NIES2098_27470 [Calothrix sp. NIES-2098]